MSNYLKTDCECNEDDFVQKDGFMNELTVTITLAEYRYLIREQTRSAKQIECLEEELKKAKESAKTFMQLFMIKAPETINKLCDMFSDIFSNNKTETEEGDENGQN